MTQDNEIFTTEERSGVTAVSCNAGIAHNDNKDEVLTAHILLEDGGYRVVATLKRPNTGRIDLFSNRVFTFRNEEITNELENEVIRVRELVFTYSETGTDLTGEVFVAGDEIENEEIVTVVVQSIKDGILFPRKPKVSIIRPGGPTTPSSVSGR